MSNPFKMPDRALADHGANDDVVVGEITVRVHASGGISCSGNIGDKAFALALLAHGAQSIKDHHAPKGTIIIPPADTDFAPR